MKSFQSFIIPVSHKFDIKTWAFFFGHFCFFFLSRYTDLFLLVAFAKGAS